jgi:acyl-CoA thioester hydrolase
MADLIPTFITAVNTWQCDENDHLNVQFYTDFAHRAQALLLAEFGLGRRAQRAAGLALAAVSDHVKYLREFRVVDGVEVRSAPVEVGARHLLAYHEIRNSGDGSVAATVLRRVACEGRDWPASFRARAEAAIVVPPAIARPRSVGTLAPLPELTLAEAGKCGLIAVGRSVVMPDECDVDGAFLPRHVFGRYSDGAAILWNHLGFDRAAMQERGEGSVVVEMLNEYRSALVAGDLTVVMSGLADFSDKVMKFTHFLFEGETGRLAACAEAVGMKFDQKVRKIMPFGAEDRIRLGERRIRLRSMP